MQAPTGDEPSNPHVHILVDSPASSDRSASSNPSPARYISDSVAVPPLSLTPTLIPEYPGQVYRPPKSSVAKGTRKTHTAQSTPPLDSAAEDSSPDPAEPTIGDSERRRHRRDERRRQRKEAEALRTLQLEKEARRFFHWGFFALPLIWLLSLIYFHREYKDAKSSAEIKKCTNLSHQFVSCSISNPHFHSPVSPCTSLTQMFHSLFS